MLFHQMPPINHRLLILQILLQLLQESGEEKRRTLKSIRRYLIELKTSPILQNRRFKKEIIEKLES